jgi:probable DNA repair protein
MKSAWLDPIKKSLEKGHVVLTSNTRLADTINVAWHESIGGGTQIAPEVFSIGIWLDEHWQKLLVCSTDKKWQVRVLSKHEECVLWAQILSKNDAVQVPQPYVLAHELQNAEHQLLHQQLDLESEELKNIFSKHETSSRFLRWRTEFARVMSERGWVTQAMRDVLLGEALKKGVFARLKGILAVECSDISPLHKALLTHAAQSVHEINLDGAKKSQSRGIAFTDQHNEIERAALWARDTMRKKPNARIGIAVPQLSQCSDLVERLCQETFMPESVLAQHVNDKLPYHMDAGSCLAGAPAIRDALRLLFLISDAIATEHVYALLSSPFFKLFYLKNFMHLYKYLRNWHAHRISVADFIRLAEQSELLDLAKILSECKIDDGELASATSWCERFAQILAKCEWMDARVSTVREQMQCKTWLKTIEAFVAGEDVYGKMSAQTALSHLQHLVNDTHVRSAHSAAKIRVVDVVHAADMRFDYLWITGLGMEQWPGLPRVDPVIPLEVQKSCKMRGADFSADIKYCQELSDRLLGAAPEITLSYARHSQLGQSSQLSYLFGDIPVKEDSDDHSDVVKPYQAWYESLLASRQSHIEIQPNGELPVQGDTEKSLSTSDIKNQSACAFKAFAKKRLRASTKPSFRAPYPTLIEVGNLAHDCLQVLWNEIGSSAKLKQLSSSELHTQIERTVRTIVDKYSGSWQMEGTRRKQIWSLQSQRLINLLVLWLKTEQKWIAERGEIYIPKWLEEDIECRLSGVKFNGRIDRVDLIENEDRDGLPSVRILDYKTGNTPLSQAKVEGERPSEPQLLIYALMYMSNKSKEVRVGQIGWGNINLNSIGAGDTKKLFTLIPKEDTVNENMLSEWEDVVQGLIREYLDGKAMVAPVTGACRYCEYRPLCRIAEPC